jgi:hypothetical protein
MPAILFFIIRIRYSVSSFGDFFTISNEYLPGKEIPGLVISALSTYLYLTYLYLTYLYLTF